MSNLDDIVFSPTSIPEPELTAMLVIGAVVFWTFGLYETLGSASSSRHFICTRSADISESGF